MSEFFDTCFSPAMLAPTFLLCLCLLYWILVIVGVLGIEALDFDVDPGIDVDPGVDVDPGAHGGYVVESLKFFHLGDVPLMIVLSVFALSFWFLNYAANYYFNPQWSAWLSLMWIGPSLLLGLLITKLVMMPSAKFLAFKDNAAIDREKLIGQKAVITTSEVTETFGQAIINRKGPPIALNVRSEKGDHYNKSDVVTIIQYDRETDTFLIKPANHIES